MIERLAIGALNHLLGQAAWARRRLEPFAGRSARFQMPPWTLSLGVAPDGQLTPVADEAADVTVSLPADSPLLALGGVDQVLAQAHVTGNAEFATALSFVLRNLRWDAEEDLSRLVGDVAAHRLARGADALLGWQRDAASRLTENLAGYLGDESGLLATHRGLAELRAELEDFDGRLDRLTRRVAVLRS